MGATAGVIALVEVMAPVGILLGGVAATRVSATVGQRVAVVVVTLGALTLLGRGIGGLAGAA